MSPSSTTRSTTSLTTLLTFAILLISFTLLPTTASAAPTLIKSELLSPGWSGHSKRSSSSSSSSSTSTSAYRSRLLYPFDAADIVHAGCQSSCMDFSRLNVTCGASYYNPSCNLCSTQGMDAYLTCSMCWSDATTNPLSSSSSRDRATDLAHIQNSLNRMESTCSSLTRTALPSPNMTSSLTAAMISSPVSASSGLPTLGSLKTSSLPMLVLLGLVMMVTI